VTRDLDAILRHQPTGAGIPRVLHQVYLGRPLPPDLASVVARVREVNPTWEHRLYDDARMTEYVSTHFGPDVAAYLTRIDDHYLAARADLFRYLVVYREGGVYLDVKSVTERPLDDVLRPDDVFLLAQWDNSAGSFTGFGVHAEVAHVPGGEYQQWWLASAAGHPFLRAAILRVMGNLDGYRVRRAGVGMHGVLRTTGPLAYTTAIAPIVREHPFRRLTDEREVGLAYSTLPGLSHARADPRHYSRQWRPVARVGGVGGFDNDVSAWAVKGWYVADWRVRDLLRRVRSRG
jgi:mannosyltransferase OCH1-like enzyme